MIVKSASPDVNIPEVSISDFVLRHAARLGDKPALIDAPSGRILTYRQLGENVRAAAAGLAARGFRKGDVFAIYSPNTLEYAVIFLAVASVGGINTTANPLYTADELARQLIDSRARFLVTVPPFLDKAKEAAKKSAIEEIFVFGSADESTPFSDLLQAGTDAPTVRPVSIDPREDLVALPYSSGTTGLPKGVMLTHRNPIAYLCQMEGMRNFDCFNERDVIMAVLPFFHIYGMVVVMNLSLHLGATVVTMPRFELEECLNTLQKYRVSYEIGRAHV